MTRLTFANDGVGPLGRAVTAIDAMEDFSRVNDWVRHLILLKLGSSAIYSL